MEIETKKKKMKYLGIRFDSMLSFRHHFLMAADRVVGYQSRLMRNLGGPREARRMIKMSVATSILLPQYEPPK